MTATGGNAMEIIVIGVLLVVVFVLFDSAVRR
jgi:hypothetical protein